MSKNILLSVVFGDEIQPDGSNIIQALIVDVVPQIGSEFISKKIGRCKVKNIIYDYTQLENSDINDPSSGSVRVWMYV